MIIYCYSSHSHLRHDGADFLNAPNSLWTITKTGLFQDKKVRGFTLDIFFSPDAHYEYKKVIRAAERYVNEELGLEAVHFYPMEINCDEQWEKEPDRISTVCFNRSFPPILAKARASVTESVFFNYPPVYTITNNDDRLKYARSWYKFKPNDITECDVGVSYHIAFEHFKYQVKVLAHEVFHCLGFAHYRKGIMHSNWIDSYSYLPNRQITNWKNLVSEKYGKFIEKRRFPRREVLHPDKHDVWITNNWDNKEEAK